jgi:hypothetical protein
VAKTWKDQKDFIKTKKKTPKPTKGRENSKSENEIIEEMIEEGLYGI